MKIAASGLTLLMCFLGFASQADELKTKAIRLEWDHWLWMERIANQDPLWKPKNFDPANREIRLFERKSAMANYGACGLKVMEGESFIYGSLTLLMIVRLRSENERRVGQIHRTIQAWRAGKTSEWHLDWVPRSQ